MSWSSALDTLNTSVLATFGAVATFTHGATSTSVQADVRKSSEPLLIGNAVTFSEHHYIGQCRIADLPTEPVIGDTLTHGGVTYVIDQPPAHADGLYRLILRRRP